MNITLTGSLMDSSVTRLCRTRFYYSVLFIFLGIAALAASAQVVVPLVPVPITLQSFVVLLIPSLYGWRQGLLTVVLYVACGVLGMPIFAAGQSGYAVMTSPVGGYLVGFMLSACVVGWLLEHGCAQRPLLVAASLGMGQFIIYTCGLWVLQGFVGWQGAIAVGLMPFIAVDITKMVVLSLLIPKLWSYKR